VDPERDPQRGEEQRDATEQRSVTVYEYVGGTPFFEMLVDHFYAGVANDPRLRPMYPERDLTGAKARLTGFLVQYWGGPADYSARRGHPRLRMRHAPFHVDRAARDAWFAHMSDAVAASGADDVVARALLDYFAHAATAMINVADPEM
jgi:hemoglobin